MSTNWGADDPSARQGADHKSDVLTGNSTPFELVHELFVGTKVARDYEESGSLFVQAMDDAGTWDLSKLAKVI
jgi:hypothetical protein